MNQSWTYPASIPFRVRNGTVLIGGDAHFWPGQRPVIWQGFVEAARELKPDLVVLNGDMIDGTRISRHGRLRGQNAPRVADEIGAARKRIDELLGVLSRDAHPVVWTLGNHDTRVDTYLANQAPEMDDFGGSLRDRFPEIDFCYAVSINDAVEVMHNFRGGIHAAWNNALHSGRTCVTNHTHQLDIKAVVDRAGRRWGVETGMLNDPGAPQFEYTQNRPSRAWPGFAVLTFDERGRLLPPELCTIANGLPVFRGEALIRRTVRRRTA